MANIGSEIERTIKWKQKGNTAYSSHAFKRALELIDLTLTGHLSFPEYKEISRMRELLVDWQLGENIYKSTDILWQKYFAAFTFASRL